MLKLLVFAIVLGGLGFVAYTVPVGGRTTLQHAASVIPWTIEVKKKPAVTKGTLDAAPAETITQSEREALDQLVRR